MISATKLAAQFRSFLDADSVLIDGEQLRPYECDGFSAYRSLPLAVALPERIEQVQAILRLCQEREVPVLGSRNRAVRRSPAPRARPALLICV